MKRLALLSIVTVLLGGSAGAQQSGATSSPSHNPPVSTIPAKSSQVTITPEEWQELRGARAVALRTNPNLIAENKKLMDRMRAFEDKVDAAMVKANPTIAPLIAKFEAGRQQRPGMSGSSTPTTSANGK